MLNDWDLIVATCNWNGSCNKILTQAQLDDAWTAGDGYGKMDRSELAELDLLGDWTHLRDSSDGAKARVAGVICAALGRKLVAVNAAVATLGVQNADRVALCVEAEDQEEKS